MKRLVPAARPQGQSSTVHHGQPRTRRSGADQQSPFSWSPSRQSGKDEAGGSSPPGPTAQTPACAGLSGMEYSRFLDCLAADFARLRALVPADPSSAVPSCPGWTVADPTRHVGEVYLHKTLAMREGAEPGPWPPKELADEEPLALLDRAYAGLLAEFAARR